MRSKAKTGFFVLCLSVIATVQVPAQVIEDVDNLDWDRPEAWAMKYFNSVSILTGLGPPRARETWSFEFGLELDTIPHLSEDQRRIGFGGAKVEDLNRLPVFFRPRLTIGLPAKWSLDIGYLPPIEVRGVKSHLLSVGFERPIFSSGPWTLGLRAYGQAGRIESDFTCTSEEASFEPGSEENFWGCEAPSEDRVTLNYVGAAFSGGYTVRKTTFHWGLAANYMDMEFQVDAVTFGVIDRTLLLADGWTWSLSAGSSWRLSGRTSLAIEVFYTPLSVVRPPSTSTENDPLVNFRTMLRFEL